MGNLTVPRERTYHNLAQLLKILDALSFLLNVLSCLCVFRVIDLTFLLVSNKPLMLLKNNGGRDC